MANLDLIRSLNLQYGKQSPITEKTKLFAINEQFDKNNLEKAIKSSLQNLGTDFTLYFDLGLPAEVALLFIDVCNFSILSDDMNGDGIGEYFDAYYDMIIPIIYKYGGEIDKIIGDGIICVFGPPFKDGKIEELIESADECSKEIIKITNRTPFSSKIAFHCGLINYFKNKTGLYKEFTMIGKPLTELFRLESISIDQRINYYDNTSIRGYYNKKISYNKHTTPSKWTHFGETIDNLKGVNHKNFYSIRYNN